MSECKHGYTSVFGSHALICPYCEIDRLKEELQMVHAVNRLSCATIVNLEADNSRYRKALERILDARIVFDAKDIAREALEVESGRAEG